MDFFMSCEMDKQVGDIYPEIEKEIESKLNTLKDKDYGSAVTSIGIIPIIVGQSLLDEGFFKERRLFSRKNKEADYRLRIDLKRFMESDNETRRLMVIKNVIESVRSLGEKAKKDFDAKTLEEDILRVLNVTIEKVDNTVM
jgi:hypothetical protein